MAILPVRTKLGYGFGSAAYGIKDNGFAVFLLFYYNQVIGLDGLLVAAALATALVVDAFIDPLVGHLSDNTRTKIGKRHPWLYGSAIPIALFWMLLWNPPTMSDGLTFVYLVVTAMLVRFSISAYEVPSLALLPELTPDPHERTNIMRYRFMFGWGAGLSIMAVSYGYFLAATPDFPDGQLNPQGYELYSLAGALVMIVAVLISARTTQKRIVGNYHRGQSEAPKNDGLKEVIRSFSYHPFKLLLIASLLAYTNQGLIFALTTYLFRHVWELSELAFLGYSLLLFVGVILAFLTVTPLSKRIGKPKAASYFAAISLAIGVAPYWLRLADLFPANGSAILVPTLFTFAVSAKGFGIAAMILAMSMMADIAEGYEKHTGRKSEGIFSAGMFFTQKLVGGLGLLLAGLIISFVGLPDGAARGSVATEIVTNLTLAYVSIKTVIGLALIWAFRQIPLENKDSQ
ncbi:MFS transporter [Parasphingorhabdus sp. DH2-15]|uniref:MFS transporter n=1 Tax=Parasphingorhabdus sp. DH2-15 TaxID=3444112 RepID=UPI003F6861F9